MQQIILISLTNVVHDGSVPVPLAAVDEVDQGSVPVVAQVDLLSAYCGVLLSDLAVILIK